ncbi:hypothetical protein SUGI_0018490 [Cryptomeria japonica]|nr:hypothetical protein SUGI_0018490 [Cryptomeria japonica]
MERWWPGGDRAEQGAQQHCNKKGYRQKLQNLGEDCRQTGREANIGTRKETVSAANRKKGAATTMTRTRQKCRAIGDGAGRMQGEAEKGAFVLKSLEWVILLTIFFYIVCANMRLMNSYMLKLEQRCRCIESLRKRKEQLIQKDSNA